jgi:hypothetical protein
MENENFDIVDFLEIEHTDESRSEASAHAAFFIPWSM